MVIIHTSKEKLLFKYIFKSERYPNHLDGFKGVMAIRKSIFAQIKKRDWSGASRSFEQFVVALLEYLDACRYFFGYPLISILILFIIWIPFSLAQAGCVLVAFAVCIEGYSVMALQRRLSVFEKGVASPSVDRKNKYTISKHLKKLQSIHPNLLKWSIVNVVIGTLLWGFAPAACC